MEAPDDAQAVLGQVLEIVPERYYITAERGLPALEQDMPWHWVQLGKAHRVRGDLAFERPERENNLFKQARARRDITASREYLENACLHLKEVATQYAPAEAYDDLYGRGQTHRDQKRSEVQIYDRLKGLNVEELALMREAIQATADQYRLGEKSRMATLLESWFIQPEEV